MFRVLTGLLAFVFFSSAAMGTDLEVKDRGKGTAKSSLEKLTEALGVEEVSITDHLSGEQVTYQAFSVRKLLAHFYGKKWESREELLLTCVDGYQPTIPVKEFVDFDGYLAFSRTDRKPLSYYDRAKKKVVELGPFYLIWKGRPHYDEGSWAYQIVGMDMIRFDERFTGVAPPDTAPKSAKEGFLIFRKHCMTCHKVNGQGGEVAFDLNVPVSVTEYFKKGWLEKWIINPPAMRNRTLMPVFAPAHPRRKQMVKDVVSYLEVMADHKR